MNVGAIHFGKAYQVTGMDDGGLKRFCETAVKAHPNKVADWFDVAEEEGAGDKKTLKNHFYYLTFQDAADWNGLQAGINAIFPETDQSPLAQQMRKDALENLKRSYVASREKIETLDVSPVKAGQGLLLNLNG